MRRFSKGLLPASAWCCALGVPPAMCPHICAHGPATTSARARICCMLAKGQCVHGNSTRISCREGSGAYTLCPHCGHPYNVCRGLWVSGVNKCVVTGRNAKFASTSTHRKPYALPLSAGSVPSCVPSAPLRVGRSDCQGCPTRPSCGTPRDASINCGAFAARLPLAAKANLHHDAAGVCHSLMELPDSRFPPFSSLHLQWTPALLRYFRAFPAHW